MARQTGGCPGTCESSLLLASFTGGLQVLRKQRPSKPLLLLPTEIAKVAQLDFIQLAKDRLSQVKRLSLLNAGRQKDAGGLRKDRFWQQVADEPTSS